MTIRERILIIEAIGKLSLGTLVCVLLGCVVWSNHLDREQRNDHFADHLTKQVETLEAIRAGQADFQGDLVEAIKDLERGD